MSQTIDRLNEKTVWSALRKNKLVTFLNQDNAVENYIKKDKSAKVQIPQKALTQKTNLMISYLSGNSKVDKTGWLNL